MINRCQKDFMLINNFLEINKQIIGIRFKFILTEFLSEWMCHPFLLECDYMCVTLRHLKTICHEPLETAYQYLKYMINMVWFMEYHWFLICELQVESGWHTVWSKPMTHPSAD